MTDKYIILFFIFSFLGYVSEVIYCSVPKHRFVNRGFLYGPYLPIYGSGAMIVLIVLEPVHDYPVLVFVLGLVFTSILEYFTSWALEKLFSVKLWDYSAHRININGRVCMLNSTLFGIMSLALVYIVNPPVSRFIDRIPMIIQHYAAYAITIGMSIDATLSVVKMNSFKEGLRRIRTAREDILEKVRVLEGEGKAELAAELRARLEADFDRRYEEFCGKARHIIMSNPTITAGSETIRSDLAILSDWAREKRDIRKRFHEDMRKSDQAHIDAIRGRKK